MMNKKYAEIDLSKSIDLTQIWNKAHAHLIPNVEYILDHPQIVETCPACQQLQAVRLVVNLQLGGDYWVRQAHIFYCHACKAYLLSAEQHNIYYNQAVKSRNLLPADEAAQKYAQVTDVDARLWSSNPDFLSLEPTTRCNFNCWYCIGRSMQQGDIDEKDYDKIMAHFPGMKVMALVGEGEPFMHKGFFRMAKKAVDQGIKLLTISNGSTLSQSVVEKICDSGLHYIAISIDSTDPEVFASSRLDGKLQQVWQGIEKLVRYRDEHQLEYPKIGLKGTLFEYSKDELPGIVARAKQSGIDILESFQPLNMKQSYVDIYPREHLHLLDTSDEIQQIINKDYQMVQQNEETRITSIAEFADKEGFDLNNHGSVNGIRPNCDEKWITALQSGEIIPCCQIKDPVSKHWNLVNYSVSEIMQMPDYENMRFNLWNGLFLKQCKGCGKTH